LSEELLSVPRLAVDTAPLVYFLVGAPRRANLVRQVLARAAQGDLELVVSAMTKERRTLFDALGLGRYT